MPGNEDAHGASAPRRVLPFIYVTLAVVLGFFLFTEHQAHLFGALPFLLLLTCPLMHMFMHRGHAHGGHSHGSSRDGDDAQRS